MFLPPRRRALAPLVLAALAACGRDAEPAGVGFPVRLLPVAASSAIRPLLQDDFDDLTAWRVLDYHAQTLEPAGGHPGVLLHDGAVYLTQPWLFLVRLVDLPASPGLLVHASLAGDQAIVPGALCPHLFLPLVQDASHGESGYEILARGSARTSPTKEVPLGQLLPQRLEKGLGQASSTWTVPRGADGFAAARLKHVGRLAEVRALVLSALSGPVAITSLRIEPKPELTRLVAVDSASAGAAAVRPLLAPVRASMEQRPSLILPPGSEHVLEAEVPAGATALSFGVVVDPGVCTRPEPDPPPSARWRIDLAWDGAEPVRLGEGRVRHDGSRPAAYEEVRLAWPKSFPGPARARLRFSAEGDVGVVFGQPLVRGPAARRPNVLLVSLDTVRADHLGYHGYPRPSSPALDRLASRSAAFLNASSVGPYTLPTHATMFTGLLPLRHGVTDSWADRLDAARQPYLPRLLAEAGWVTAGFCGGGFLSADFGFADGFDLYRTVDPVVHHESTFNRRRYARDEPPHLEAIERGGAIEGIAEWIAANQDVPWFAFVHTYAPHEYDPPADLFALFDTAPGSDWGTDARDIAERLKPKAWPTNPPGPADVEHLTNLYDAALRHTDVRLGRLLDDLERRGLLQDTLVIVTSDHGEELFEHRGLRHSVTLYEEMLSVPLLVQAPGVRARRVQDPVTLADVAPTILEWLGLPVPQQLDGRSLVPVLRGEDHSALERVILSAHVETSISRRSSLRLGRLKLIRGDVSDQVLFPARAEWELYDLAEDPGETRNLAGERPHDREALAASLAALEAGQRARSVGAALSDLSPEVLEQLEALGYLGGR